jgi:alpha-tubulin suppressor-like RCC1 family protein
MSAVSTKQIFTDETNNASWLSNWLYKTVVLFLALFLVGCSCCCTNGDDNNSSYTSNENKSIAIGYGQSFIIDNSDNGKVYVAGLNDCGQLGIGDNNDRNVFTEISSISDKNVIAISAGFDHSLVLSNDGRVYAAGWNRQGQLGLGDTNNRTVFTEVSSLSDKNIVAIAAGYNHSLALSDNGKIYAAGYNQRGQFGLSYTDNRSVFAEVSSLSGKYIINIAENELHSLALSNEGKVYALGGNYNGQLGLGDTDNRGVFTEVPSLNNITAIAVGNFHSLALSDDGKVYAVGKNKFGQLGLGDTNDLSFFTEVPFLSDKNIVAIAAGYEHSLALSDDGRVYAAGWNQQGQLGLGDNDDRNVFTEVLSLSDKNVIAINAGFDHSLVLSIDDRVYAAGRNSYGQLGLGLDYNDVCNVFTEVNIILNLPISNCRTDHY